MSCRINHLLRGIFTVAAVTVLPFAAQAGDVTKLIIRNQDSLATAGDFVHTEITPAGKKIAVRLHELLSEPKLNTGELKKLAAQCAEFSPAKIANREMIALGWILETMVSGAKPKFKNDLEEAYFIFFTENKCSRLKTYLLAQYKLSGYETMEPEQLMQNLNLFQNALIYNSPYREKWEPVDQILKLVAVKPGESVIDYGCRQGYYSIRFRDLVGKNGMVYCLDNDRGHIDFLQKFIVQYDIPNMLATKSSDGNIGLVSNKADVIFINQMYHFIYIYAPRVQQKQLLNSMKKTLRNGGRLIILDNNPVKGVSGYTLDPRLIEAQLSFYGFKLSRHIQLTPYVYYLEFINRK